MTDNPQGENDHGRKGPDGTVRFYLSPDGMKLGVNRYLPPLPGGRPLTAKSIRSQLQEAGVTLDPVEGAIDKILERLSSGQDYRKIVLVRGLEPVDASHGRIEPLGDLRMPVFSGQVIARKIPPTHAQPGRSIDGREIPPTKTIEGRLQDVIPKAGDNVAYDSTEQTFTATAYGMAAIREGTVSVKPGLYIDEDEIHVLGLVYHRDHLGNEITPEMFLPELEKLGVLVGPAEEHLAQAFETTRQDRQIAKDVIVAMGKEPEPGRDGWLEILVERQVDDQREDAAGRIDYRHRASLPMVEPGQTVACVHPPEPGQGGIDLFKKTIPAKNGRTLSVSAGKGVKRLGKDSFEATDKGLLMYERGVLSVSQVLMVKKDVDLSTGHITAEFGSVQVRGNVISGMKVSAPDHVLVESTVESAEVVSGGDVEVRGGILMPDGGKVRAKGNVMAQFATNADIEAEGDVIIGNYATNCRINVKGTLTAIQGKGVVQGGVISTHTGIEVNELGSELGVATDVIISHRQRDHAPMIDARGKIKRELERICERIGDGDARSILEATAPAKREAMAEVLKYRIRLERKFKKINEFMKKDVELRQKALSHCRIKVRRRIHPGVNIKIGGRVLRIDRAVDRSQIYLDLDARAIVIRNI